jgi:hypothetical protein
MSLTMLAVVVDCAEPRQQAEFWAQVLAGTVTERNPDEFLLKGSPQVTTPLYFMQVPEPAVGKNRWHIDVVTDGSMSDEVERVVALGARFVEARVDPDAYDNPDTWTVLEDPEGNVFCLTSTQTLTGLD